MYGPESGLEGCRHLLLAASGSVERQRLKRGLCAAGYRVTAVSSPCQGERLARTLSFDAVVLSAGLAGHFSGSPAWLEPSLIVWVEALEAGGSSMGERGRRHQRLIDRVARVLRDRPLEGSGVPRIVMGPATFDLMETHLVIDGSRRPLSPVQTFTLRRLALAGGRVVPRDRLRPRPDFGRGVDVTIARLRRLVEVDSQQPRYIHSIQGRGYRLVADPIALNGF
ncbi:MAG: response regulator transcription factor [Brevundimonas sp.]|nr:response regulator transcription factor [Brevundimonas sp.]